MADKCKGSKLLGLVMADGTIHCYYCERVLTPSPKQPDLLPSHKARR